MKAIEISAASRPLAEYAKELGDDILVLTTRNKPVAAIVPLKVLDRESLVLASHPEFLKLIARSRREFAAGRTVSLEEMKQAVLPPREVDEWVGRPRRMGRSTASRGHRLRRPRSRRPR